MEEKKILTSADAIRILWRNWVVINGIPVALIILSLVVNTDWLPVVVFATELAIYAMVRHNNEREAPSCLLLPFVMTRLLFWSGLVMVACNYLWSMGYYAEWFDTYNVENPYIVVLVMAPIGVAVFGWAKIRGFSIGYCVRCRARNGSPAERGFVGRLFSSEGQFQLEFILWQCVVLTLVCYFYYFFVYINVNFNSSDLFFFIWLPVVFYLVSLVYMALRYFNVWAYYSQNLLTDDVSRATSSTLRYLIFSNEEIFLCEDHDPDGMLAGDDRLDTPASLTFFFRERVQEFEARRCFSELSGIREYQLRPMYRSTAMSANNNTFHYIVDLDSPESVEGSRLKGRWYTMNELNVLLNSNRLMPMLASEIHRLYVMTMAWKTYDIHGRRRYKIKNYRPTFRLKDIVNWDIDFNDPIWMYVAANNEDKPFFGIKRFWRKYVSGVGQ